MKFKDRWDEMRDKHREGGRMNNFKEGNKLNTERIN
jgi:hypothetical protein